MKTCFDGVKLVNTNRQDDKKSIEDINNLIKLREKRSITHVLDTITIANKR